MITLNGQKREYKKLTIAELLRTEGFRIDTVAVEINEEVIPKKTYETVFLKDDDVIEVISFVGGG